VIVARCSSERDVLKMGVRLSLCESHDYSVLTLRGGVWSTLYVTEVSDVLFSAFRAGAVMW
jgi:hypothetical protein